MDEMNVFLKEFIRGTSNLY